MGGEELGGDGRGGGILCGGVSEISSGQAGAANTERSEPSDPEVLQRCLHQSKAVPSPLHHPAGVDGPLWR